MKRTDLSKLIDETERLVNPLARVLNRSRIPGGIASGLALIAIGAGTARAAGLPARTLARVLNVVAQGAKRQR
jgi:hypothetical protein